MPNSDDALKHRSQNDNSVGSDSTDAGLGIDAPIADISPAYATIPAELKKQPKLIPNGKQAILWYGVSILVIVVDQLTKLYFHTRFELYESVSVIEPVLNWTLAYNYGAAFSFLANQGGWQKWFFSGLALLMSAFLIVYLLKAPRVARVLNLGLAFILGGAIGNLIDRMRIGKVIDFIHVHYMDVWHYPIFNIADMAICAGVALVLYDMFFLESKRHGR